MPPALLGSAYRETGFCSQQVASSLPRNPFYEGMFYTTIPGLTKGFAKSIHGCNELSVIGGKRNELAGVFPVQRRHVDHFGSFCFHDKSIPYFRWKCSSTSLPNFYPNQRPICGAWCLASEFQGTFLLNFLSASSGAGKAVKQLRPLGLCRSDSPASVPDSPAESREAITAKRCLIC